MTNDLVAEMKPGSVLVEIAVDQGGCFEDTRPTTHADPTYRDASVRRRAGRQGVGAALREDSSLEVPQLHRLAEGGW